ncbi:MAG TPA: class I SAM-dependent RNA methyltransferase [Terriglobia bacterium]|nr:class I SAM-dependent RNA methyltransferase [Terriglobia bacterium]
MSQPFEFSAEKLVFGGDALGHHLGRVIFVPRALPGERLEVEEVRAAKGVVHALPLRILAAAPERIDAPCPYFGRCGGCQYQHFPSDMQTATKVEILRETLRRIGKIFWSAEIPSHAASPWNYRNQAQFKVAFTDGGRVELGFFEAESHKLVPIDNCLILSPCLNAMVAELRPPEWSSRLTACREIDLLADDSDQRAVVTFRGSFSAQESEALAKDCLERCKTLASVVIEGGSGPRTFGEPAMHYCVGDFEYRVSPGSFFQASRFLLPEFVKSVTAAERGGLALDLFAGVGLLSLPLARHFEQVVAVEGNQAAAADLAANAKAHLLQNVRAVADTVFDFLRRYARSAPDLVVLDPPRAGVGSSTLKLISAIRPQRITYVSCHPPTLARDLGFLIAHGYALDSVEMFDFFPQTYHIECVARLSAQKP